jgi:DNA-binding NtrC family response regulator
VTTAATIRRSVDRLPGQAKLAIRFDHTVHGSRLQLKHAIELKWTSHEVAVKASALIMVDDEAIREQMSDAVAALKVRPLTADMPDAALWHLTGEGNAITSVIVDEELFGDQTLRWFSFLRAVYPHVRRIILSRGMSRWRLAQLLSSRAVDGLLEVPWNARGLEELVRSH